MTAPVLVAGAGPVGLTAAAAFTRHGIPCRIIDKAPVPSDKSKALAVWCRTMELLDGLELAETFVSTGRKLTGGNIYAEGKRVVHLALTTDESPYGFPLMLPQNITERLLTEHLEQQGITVQRQVELVDFQETETGVSCTLRHADGSEEALETPWLIGCDGAHSIVRHRLGMEFTGHAEPSDWMLADVHIEGSLAADQVSIFWHPDGVLAFFPIDADRFRIIADLGAASDTPRPELTLPDVQSLTENRGPGGLALTDPVWLAYFRINERKVEEYCRGRVLLAGDAAHIHSPAGGQGMNTGMQDAFNLAWKIALVEQGRGQLGPLLHSYSVERSAVGDQVLSNAERFTKMTTLRSPAAQWMRNHLAPIVSSFPFVQNKIRNEWMELSINYRHSPLTGENSSSPAGDVRAGDRFPDAMLTNISSGEEVRMLSLFRTTKHLLLLFSQPGDLQSILDLAEIAESIQSAFPDLFQPHLICDAHSTLPASPDKLRIPIWREAADRLHELLNVQDNVVAIVRPDGYVGMISQPAEGQAVRDYLDSYLISAKSDA